MLASSVVIGPPPWVVRGWIGLAVAIALLTFAPRTYAQTLVVDLYTIGPSPALMSAYGHSALCVGQVDASAADTRCYDYGVTHTTGFVDVAWAAINGQPDFVPTEVTRATLLRAFQDQGRRIERQRIPLEDAEARALASALETDVRERRLYAYHPYWNNCATKLRDRLDEATRGHLRSVETPWTNASFRQLSEAGLSGRLPELTVMALGLGGYADRAPTRWEAMFLPNALRDTVAERFGVAPDVIHEQVDHVLPTSTHVGRAALVFLGFLLFAALRFGPRWVSRRTILIGVCSILGLLGLLVDALSVLVPWPEVRMNWALSLLLPTDLAIPWLPSKLRHKYLVLRIGVSALVLMASVIGLIAQPVWPIAIVALAPLLELLRSERSKLR